eukprot:6458864-Pyramimonas_sp.AAC.1
MCENGLALGSRRPKGNLIHPRANWLFPKEQALQVVLHDGNLATDSDVGKVIPVVLVPGVMADSCVKTGQRACGSAIGL